MREVFTALGTLFLAAQYAFMVASSPFVSMFIGLLALTALVAVKTDQLREEAANKVRQTSGQNSTFRLPDMSFAPARAVAKPVVRRTAVKAA